MAQKAKAIALGAAIAVGGASTGVLMAKGKHKYKHEWKTIAEPGAAKEQNNKRKILNINDNKDDEKFTNSVSEYGNETDDGNHDKVYYSALIFISFYYRGRVVCR